eukprot:scaffold108184_cov33-Prasinocladus_malaysianus.AAC.3
MSTWAFAFPLEHRQLDHHNGQCHVRPSGSRPRAFIGGLKALRFHSSVPTIASRSQFDGLLNPIPIFVA